MNYKKKIHIKSLNTKKIRTYADGYPGPCWRQTQKYGGVKPVDGIPNMFYFQT